MDLLRFVAQMRLPLYQCGQVATALQGRVTREEKEPDSEHQISTSVSVVDRLCQEILMLGAHEATPGLEVQSEELEDCPIEILSLYADNRHRYALILDPVDGTGDYLDVKPSYAHMLGLLDQETGRMACSMIYFPERLRLYLGIRGMGAFVSDGLWATPRPMRPTTAPKTVEDVKRLRPKDYCVFKELGYAVVPPESASAAFELTRIAEGHLGVMAMRHFHGHDTAMSSVIIEELGGAVLDEHGCPVTFDKEMQRTPLVISSLRREYAYELARSL